MEGVFEDGGRTSIRDTLRSDLQEWGVCPTVQTRVAVIMSAVREANAVPDPLGTNDREGHKHSAQEFLGSHSTCNRNEGCDGPIHSKVVQTKSW